MGDPKGDGTGGCSIFGLIDSYQTSLASSNNRNITQKAPPDVTKSQRRFLQSQGRLLPPDELNQKGVVIAMEMGNVPHTIGSQFLITLSENNALKDLLSSSEEDGGNDGKAKQNNPRYISLGTITEDSQDILAKLNRAYCDDDGRPFADIRIQRALVIHDPFEDPAGMEELLQWRGVTVDEEKNDNLANDIKEGYPLAPQSPTYDRPPEETVTVRIEADDTTLFATAGWDDNDAAREYEDEDEEDEAARQKRLELQEKQEEGWRQRQDTSRAVMLEMLGDRPSADIKAPENVLFVCKLNPFTGDEDLELIFSRFDSEAKADIIRDPDTGASLQYAFVEFTSNEACNEAYLKMNNALVDDRRIRVDFSQSVANVWDRYNKKYRMGDRSGIDRGFIDGRGSGRGRGRGNRGGNNPSNHRSQDQLSYRPRGHQQHQAASRNDGQGKKDPEFDNFGRITRPTDANETKHNHHSSHQKDGHGRNRHPRSNSRSRSPSRDVVREERRRRSRSGSRKRNHSSRRTRSRSDDSSDHSRRKKKHHKHRRRDSSRGKESRSHEHEKKRKKHHRHREREYSDEDDEKHGRTHRRRHRRSDDKHHRRSGERSRSRS